MSLTDITLLAVNPLKAPSNALGFLQAGALQYADSLVVRPKRGFDIGYSNIVPQVVVRESHQDNLQITDHPVEQGAMITDHAFILPSEVEIECAWSDSPSSPGLLNGAIGAVRATPVGAKSLITGNSQSQVNDFYATMLALQTSRTPINCYTGRRKYTDMLVKSVSTSTDAAHSSSLIVRVTLRKIITVSTSTTAIAPPSKQAAPALTAQDSDVGSQTLQETGKFNSSAAGVAP